MAYFELRQAFSIAYDGDDRRDDHTIDAELLAPALAAVSLLIREANAEFNGQESKTRVLVVSDFEHKCFNINFEIVLQLYEHIKSLLADPEIRSAKDLLEWIGLVGAPVVPGLTLLGYLKWRRGREVEKSPPDENGNVQVQVKGDGNSVRVTNHIIKLAENPAALRAVRDAFKPVGKNGFDKIEVRADGAIDVLESPEIDDIRESANVGIEESSKETTEDDDRPKDAWLSVYSPVFDESAPLWRFKLGTDVIYADISDTTIAADALARGGASPNDAYNVRLQVTNPSGRPHFKIVDVMRFVPALPAPQQTSLDLRPPLAAARTRPRVRQRPRPKKK
jgi:hypothetical protein